ncbi:MAG: APC family permease [Cyanobium sp.]
MSGAPPSAPLAAPAPTQLRRCLGPVAVTAQAVATVGLTLTAVINIPAAAQAAGRATWIAYGIALVAVLLVSETLVLFRREPAQASGIAGYVGVGLGARAGALASWALLLGYGASALACLAFLGFYLCRLVAHLGLPLLPAVGFLAGGLACLEMTRRDVRLSTGTMLFTEGLSVLIVLGLCLVVLRHGGSAADLEALNPSGDQFTQVRAGLMVAVLSFLGFESAANLGTEALRPERAVPRALRTAVLLSGVLFLFWAVVLTEGLGWLPLAERTGLDPISLLADRLGQTGAGRWIEIGAFLCLFGSSLGSLTALGRVGFSLAERGVLPRRLAAIHPCSQTPSAALLALGLPVISLGTLLVLRGLSAHTLFELLGGFAVLGFLLVYGLVAIASLRTPLTGSTLRRRVLVSGTCLVAVLAVAVAYLGSLVGQQNDLLLSFVGLMGVGSVLVGRRL